MFDVSLSVINTILILLSFVFVLSLFVFYLTASWAEIPGVNEPNTYGSKRTVGVKDKEDRLVYHNTMLLSDSIAEK